MGTLVKTFSFPSDTESFTFTSDSGKSTGVWDGTDGDPANGSLSYVSDGRNNTELNGHWDLTTTWEGLGVPSDVTITGVTVASMNHKCTIYDFANYLINGGATLIDGATTINLSSAVASYIAPTSWANSTGVDSTGLSLASSNSITLSISGSNDHINNTNAHTAMLRDELTFTITYDDGSQTIPTDLPLTTSSSASINPVKSITTGLPTTAALALAATVVVGINIGLTNETDISNANSILKEQAISLTESSDVSFQLSTLKEQVIGLSEEVDISNANSILKEQVIGLSESVSESFQLSAAKNQLIGLSETNDISFLLNSAKDKAINLPEETDSSLALITSVNIPINLSEETNNSFVINRLKEQVISLSESTDSSFSIVPDRLTSILQAIEADSALALVMQTVIVKYAIRTADGWNSMSAPEQAEYSGYFTSLSAFKAIVPDDLITPDECWKAYCYADWASPGLNDYTNFTSSGTSSVNYIEITSPLSEYHQGLRDSGFLIYSDSYYYAIILTADYSRINNIGFGKSLYGGWSLNLKFDYGSIGGLVDSLVIDSNVDGDHTSIVCRGSSQTIRNCIMFGTGSTGSTAMSANTVSTAVIFADNVTIVNADRGFQLDSGSIATVKNTVLYDCTKVLSESSGITADSSNNAYSAGTTNATNFNPVITDVDSADFLSVTNDNYHLSRLSSLIGEGINLYSEFIKDIDGDTQPSSGAWDIGADFYAVLDQTVDLGLPIETDIAQIVSAGILFTIHQSLETDSAFIVIGPKHVFLTQSTEVDSSFVVRPPLRLIKYAIRTTTGWDSMTGPEQAEYKGYFTSLSAFLTLTPTNLIDKNQKWQADCYDDWASPGLDDSIQYINENCDSINNIKLTVPIDESHKGIIGDGFKVSTTSSSYILDLLCSYIALDRINFYKPLFATTSRILIFRDLSDFCVISNCIFDGNLNATGSHYSAYLHGLSTVIYNSLFLNYPDTNQGAISAESVSATIHKIYNCVFNNIYVLFRPSSPTKLNIVNSVFIDAAHETWSDYRNNFICEKNAANDDNFEVYMGVEIDVTSVDFVNYANKNFHQAQGSKLRHFGINYSAMFTEDIDGDTRNATEAWDVGFDHYIIVPLFQDIGLSLESDSTLSINSIRGLWAILDQALENDSSFGVSRKNFNQIGLSSEVDFASIIQTSLSTWLLNVGTEVNSSFAIDTLKEKLIGLSNETDIAFDVIRAAIVKVIDIAIETNIAFDVIRSGISQAILLANENDSALLVSKLKELLIGLSDETDLSLLLTGLKELLIGQSNETDSALLISGLKELLIGQSNETDLSLLITGLKELLINQAGETDLGFTVNELKSILLNIIDETDISFPLFVPKIRVINQPSEDNTSFVVSIPLTNLVGASEETDEAFAIDHIFSAILGLSLEEDTANITSISKLKLINLANEIDEAFNNSSLKNYQLNLSTETNTATIVKHIISSILGLTLEVDNSTIIDIDRGFDTNLTNETDSAFENLHSKLRTLDIASETDIAFIVSSSAATVIGVSLEYDLANDIDKKKLYSLLFGNEFDNSLAITRIKYYTFNTSFETDSGFDINKSKAKAIIIADEIDSGLENNISKLKEIIQATEDDLSLLIIHSFTSHVGQSLETDLSFDMSLNRTYELIQSQEVDLSNSIDHRFTAHIGLSTEEDIAQAVTQIGFVIVNSAYEIDEALANTISKLALINLASETDIANVFTITSVFVNRMRFDVYISKSIVESVTINKLLREDVQITTKINEQVLIGKAIRNKVEL